MSHISKTRILLHVFALLIAAATPLAAQPTVAVVNAATFDGQFPLSPGCWATAFGDFASVGVSTTFADAVPFPTALGGVQVLVDGVPAPMNFVGGGQVNFLVPSGASEGRVALRIAVSGMTTYEGEIRIWPVSPGLLSLDPANPARPAAALNQDGPVNSESNPARKGEVVVIYGVGADFSELPDVDGAPAPGDRLINTSSESKVWISVYEAAVQFSGLAPSLVNAWQINAVVPQGAYPAGQTGVVAEAYGTKTNLVSIWVAD